jgi:hypothetical protein
MRRLFYTSGNLSWEKKPWLVLGKGPTIDRYASIDVGRYNVLALNHTVTLGPCAIAHAIDMEVLDDVGEDIKRNAKYLFMPERPHVGMTQGPPIEEHLSKNKILGAMEQSGRLVTYKKYVASARIAPPGVVPVMYFSGEAAFGILAAMGILDVYSLGIDGGASYGETFSYLKPLENGRKDFDEHIAAIHDILSRNKMTWTRLGAEARHG